MSGHLKATLHLKLRIRQTSKESTQVLSPAIDPSRQVKSNIGLVCSLHVDDRELTYASTLQRISYSYVTLVMNSIVSLSTGEFMNPREQSSLGDKNADRS